MVIGSGRGDVVCCFFGEDLSKVGVFRREGDLGFHPFGGDSEFRCHGEFGNEWGVWEESFAIASEDSVYLAIIQGVLEVLILCVVVEVVIEVGIIDGIYVDMAMGARKGFSKERVVSLGICGVGGIEIF